jgi:hypothetical protein
MESVSSPSSRKALLFRLTRLILLGQGCRRTSCPVQDTAPRALIRLG